MPLQRIAKKIAGDYNAKQLKAFDPLVAKINEYYEAWHELSDEQVQAKTAEFRSRVEQGESLDDILPEAFATVKQAAKRLMGTAIMVKGDELTWNMVHYDVQLIGGIVLHQSGIAEMRTGEGKTLVATLPCYLNALTGKGVHVVTVNDYLASRDAEWMGYLYNRLGLTVGSVTKKTSLDTRREEYEKDITYVENSELGFDYLRDNLAVSMEQRKMMWRPLHYALIDEVDSILIDEARTPMIISQPSEEATEKYEYYGKLITLLTPSKVKKKVKKGFLHELLKEVKKEDEEEDDGGDYYIDEKTKSASLSSAGIAKLEKLLKVENLYKDLGYQEIHHIENALRAQACYARDKEYLVRDGQILLVDDNTGRVMPGRRFSQGLHQALEAKEKVQVQRESKTMASITYQHFFKQYEKLSGMTGTALTEAEEFEKIYELEVLTIPTNKPILRVDKSDAVYFNQDAKWKAVVDHIKFYHGVGVPILIGTSSIQTSELMSSILTKMTLPHTVLNAKFHEQEANIVKNAGKKGSVVVATNMAGRGTDIKLSDELFNSLASKYAAWMSKSLASGGASGVVYSSWEYDMTLEALKTQFQLADEDVALAEKGGISRETFTLAIKLNTAKKTKEDAYAEIIMRGEKEGEVEERDLHYGLFILGTEKHESRRIDNQLRGRAGRQGDPGVSQFFVAMDDEIMRKVGGDKIQSVARMMLSKEQLEEMVFTQKQFTSSIARAQKQMEGRHFSSRKHLFDYDSVINKQRERIYAKRDMILMKSDEPFDKLRVTDEVGGSVSAAVVGKDTIVELSVIDEIKASIDDILGNLVVTYTASKPWNITELLEELSQITGAAFAEEEFASITSTAVLEEKLSHILHDLFDAKFADIEEEKALDLARRVYLSVLDRNRQNHIDEMQYLREKVGLYGYAQLDPLVIYKKEAYDKFQRLLSTLKIETLANTFRTDFVALAAGRGQATRVPRKVNMVDVLKAVTEGLKAKRTPLRPSGTSPQGEEKKQFVELENGEQAEVLEDDGDIEVLEVEDTASIASTSSADTSGVKTKLRPNDRVSVRYADGRVENDVKYKKVKAIVEAGEAEVIG